MSLFTVTFDSSDDGKNDKSKVRHRENNAKTQINFRSKKYFDESPETSSSITNNPVARQNPKVQTPKIKASVRLNEKVYSNIRTKKPNKKSMIVFSSSDSSDSSDDKMKKVEATYSLTTINSDDSSDDIPFINENQEKMEVNFNPKPPAKKLPILRPFPRHSPKEEEPESPKSKPPKSFESKERILDANSENTLNSNIKDEEKKEIDKENEEKKGIDKENEENKEIKEIKEGKEKDYASEIDESNTDSQKTYPQLDYSSHSVKSELDTQGEVSPSAKSIEISASDDDNTANKDKNPKIEKRKKKHKKSESNKKSKREKSEKQMFIEKGEFENGIIDPVEIERLKSYMRRLSGHEIPADLIPYGMETISKITFHGKKIKFILSRGDVPILYAKLKNKSSSEYVAISSSPEKGAESIAQVLTGSSFSSFSLRRGGQFGGELMNIRYSMPQIDYAPRNIELYFFVPPKGVPNSLTSRKPRFTMGSTWILDINGRITQRSIKNCVLVDENNRELMSVMKVKGSEILIESNPAIGELCVFAVGISSVLCKI